MDRDAEIHLLRPETSVAVKQCRTLTPFTPFFGASPAGQLDRVLGLAFWLITFSEHGTFLAGGLPCDRPELIAEAKGFAARFKDLLERCARGSEGRVMDEAVKEAQRMLCFLNWLVAALLSGDLSANVFVGEAVHMVTETRRFLMIALDPASTPEPGMPGGDRCSMASLLDTVGFWLMDQAAHSGLLQNLIDSLESRYHHENAEWRKLLEKEGLEAQGLHAATLCGLKTMPAAGRLSREATELSVGDRDFTYDTFLHRERNDLLGVAPPLLPYHMARESEHARLVIEKMAAMCC